MDYYIDIHIKPDVEMRENVLLNKVYAKFHKTLFLLKSTDIGVSFPKYHVKLGDVLRIHGAEAKLIKLQNTNWLGGLAGYCDITQIQVKPGNVKYRTVSRKQANMTQAKLKRLIKRDSISPENIKQYKAKMFQRGLDNPYLELQSSSNENIHRRYIAFGELVDQAIPGQFDLFGLSKNATIPWF